MRLTFLILTFSMFLIGCATQPPADILSLSPNKFASGAYIVKPKDTIYSIAREQNLNYQFLARINNISPPYIIHTGQKLFLREKNSTAIATAHRNNKLPENSRIHAGPSLPAPEQAGLNIFPGTPKPITQSAATQITAKPAAKNSVMQQSMVTKPVSNEIRQTAKTQSAEANEEVIKAAPAAEIESARKHINWIWPVRGPILSRFAKGVVRKNGINIGGTEGTAVKAVAPGKVVYSGSGLRGYGHMIIVKHANNFLSAYAHNRKNLVQEGAFVKIGQQIAEMGNTGSNRVMLHFEVRHNGVAVDPEKILPKLKS